MGGDGKPSRLMEIIYNKSIDRPLFEKKKTSSEQIHRMEIRCYNFLFMNNIYIMRQY